MRLITLKFGLLVEIDHFEYFAKEC
jgi:hypothetical protein